MNPSFEQNQQQVKKQATQIKQKLLIKRQKKQQQYQKQIKQQLIKQYQQKFDLFKQEIQQYTSSQLSSLDLIKEFRLGEICQFENKIAETIRALDSQEKALMAKKEQLEDSLNEAVQFLNLKRQKEQKGKREEMEQNLEVLVKQYQERIEIQ